MSLVRSSAIIVAAFGGYALFLATLFTFGGSFALILAIVAAPAFGALAAPALVAFMPAYIGWIAERTWQPWHGRYYVFDGRQIRIAEARGTLWFSGADVHAALRIPRRAAVLATFDTSERLLHGELGDALSNRGLARLLARSTDARSLRFLQWAERDVLRPWQNKQARAAAERDATSPDAR